MNNRQRQFDIALHKNYVSMAFQMEGNKVMLPVIAGGCNGFGLISLKEFAAPHFGQWRNLHSPLLKHLYVHGCEMTATNKKL